MSAALTLESTALFSIYPIKLGFLATNFLIASLFVTSLGGSPCPVKISFDGTNFGFFEVNLEAGKRYQLTTDQPGRNLRADLLDEDGQFLNSQTIRFDQVLVQYFFQPISLL